MSVAAESVHCAAGSAYLKGSVARRAAGLCGKMGSTARIEQFAVAGRQRLLAGFTMLTSATPPVAAFRQKKEGLLALSV